MLGPSRFQRVTIVLADQKQRSAPENLRFYSRFNGDDQKEKKATFFA